MRPSAPPSFAARLGLLGVAALALGCATARKAGPSEAEAVRTIEALRAQNAAYARQLEELENRVFLLTDQLESRKVNEQRVAPPKLPEVKLHPGTEAAPAEPAEPPASLVGEEDVEYAGAAAQSQVRRPVLRLWGSEPAPPVAMVREPRPAARPAAHPAAVVVSAKGAAAPAREAAETPLRVYQQALEDLRAGRHEEAAAGFRAFARKFPDHDYADNAQYWLAECFYDRKDFSMAVREFRQVVEKFPHGNKVPDALLKVGFAYLALGSTRPGRQALEELTRTYPHHQASALASAKLAELDRLGAGAVPRSEEMR
jgi:tol-pal system protein YbgF